MFFLPGKHNASMRLSDISSAITLFVRGHRDRYLGDGATDRLESVQCTMVQLHPRRVFSPFGGDIFRSLQCGAKKGFMWNIFGLSDTDFCHLTVNISTRT